MGPAPVQWGPPGVAAGYLPRLLDAGGQTVEFDVRKCCMPIFFRVSRWDLTRNIILDRETYCEKVTQGRCPK